MVFSSLSPTELALPFDPAVQDAASRQAQQCSPQQDRWAVYLNYLCGYTVLPWLQAEYAPEAQLWLAEELPQLWTLVNGTAIALGAKRFVALPTALLDTQTLVVPQEWIDVPTWAGDYFLAIHLDPEENGLRLWGYATHDQLKTQGEYNPADRTYELDATQLIQDMAVLAVVHQLNPTERTQAAISVLPPLSAAQRQALIADLNPNPDYPPRLQIPFSQWGGLLQLPEARRQIYQQMARQKPKTARGVDLQNWLRHQFETGWQAIATLAQTSPRLAAALRQGEDEAASTLQRGRLIYQDIHDPQRRTQGMEPLATLVVRLEAQDDRPSKIQVRLYPSDRPLPAQLTLALLTAEGDPVQQVQATPEAEFIQLKRFSCPPGTTFRVQVALEEPIFTEIFVS